MRFNIIRLAALSAGCVVLAGVWGSEVPAFEPAETAASLFNNETFRHVNSKVDVTGSSLDVQATVHKWAHAGGEAALGVMENLAGLISFTSTAYAADPPTSANAGAEGGPNGCSTSGATGATMLACSTNNNAAGTDGFNGCSTSAGGSGGNTATCSAFVPLTPPNTTNNVTCSARGNGTPAIKSCSAGGTGAAATGAVGCSTAGGQTQPPTSNGATGCSASGSMSNGNSCSAAGGSATVTCSTYAGQHETCSAGNAAANNTATCSATGTATSSTTNTCSVNMAGSTANGAYGSECTAIGFGSSNTAGTATCSTQGAGTTGVCSVAAGNTGGTNNTRCTAISTSNLPGQGGVPAGFTCSASGGATGGCSVINSDGTVTDPTGTPPMCGTGYVGEPK